MFGVPRTGVEPAHLSIYAPETYASTNSAIGAWNQCPGQESNLHAVIGTTPSKWRVYQFHHLGLKSAAKIQLFSMRQCFFRKILSFFFIALLNSLFLNRIKT